EPALRQPAGTPVPGAAHRERPPSLPGRLSATAGGVASLAPVEDAGEREGRGDPQPPGLAGADARPVAVALDAAAVGLPVRRPADADERAARLADVERELVGLHLGEPDVGPVVGDH